MLLAARHQARTSFAAGRSLLPDSSEASERITHAEDVAKILRQNVVQGRKVESEEDQYREHSVVDTSIGTDGTLQELRIHKETERGDNDTIKTSSKGQGATTG